jgi:hypothetical protein
VAGAATTTTAPVNAATAPGSDAAPIAVPTAVPAAAPARPTALPPERSAPAALSAHGILWAVLKAKLAQLAHWLGWRAHKA